MGKRLFYETFLLLLALSSGNGESSLEVPPADRIVGGASIDISKVPYMLSYRINGRHACGASILNEEWGLTAAHCVRSFVDDPDFWISVRSGSNRYDGGGRIHNVTTMIYHEKYNDANNDYDIAVIKVRPPFEFDTDTGPIALPLHPEALETSWGLVVGWGYFYNFDPVLSETLQYVIVPKISRDVCARDYEDRYEVTEHQVCYGFQQGGKDACKGDSGGPLVNNSTVIGITSWGSDCGARYSPGVYTDVIGLADWVRNKIAPS